MNKYKVAEAIVANILEDLKKRMKTGTLDVENAEKETEIVDQWEDIVLSELGSANP